MGYFRLLGIVTVGLLIVLSASGVLASAEAQLIEAACNGNAETVASLLAKGCSANATDADGVTALMWASQQGYVGVVKELLKHGAKPNVKEPGGNMTALMVACAEQRISVVEELLNSGANPNEKDSRGATALMGAAEYGYAEIIELLLKKGANVNAVDQRGFSALEMSSANGHVAAVKMLLANKANANHQDSQYGGTSLAAAAGKGHAEVVRLLLANGADPGLKTKSGQTAIEFAESKGQSETARMIREAATVKTQVHQNRPRVALLPFLVDTQDQEHLGYVVSMAIQEDINAIQEIILVDIGQLGRVMGDRKWEPTAYAKAGGATEILSFTHADVLVGGKLSRKDNSWKLEPTFYWSTSGKAPESWTATGDDLWKLSDEILTRLADKLGIKLPDDVVQKVRTQPTADLKAAEELAKAQVALSQGRARQGIGACKKAVELAPEWPAAHALLGGIYLAIEDADLATSSFREALRLDPSSMCRSNLAVAYRRKGDNAQAIKDYQEVVKAYPRYPAIRVQLAVAHCYSKDNDSAIKEFKEALRLDPYVPDAHYLLGITYRQMQQLDEAAAEFRQAIKDYPADAQAFVMLAVIHQLKGDLDKAVATLKDGITANPRYGKLHNNLAAIYVAQSKYDLAWKHVHTAQDLGFEVTAVILQQLRANSTEPAR